MKLINRYRQLSLWNKLYVWGAIASIFGLFLGIIICTVQPSRIIDSGINLKNTKSANDLEIEKDKMNNQIDRLPPSYLEVTGDKPRIKKMNEVETLNMTINDFMKQGRIIMESGNFSAIEDYEFRMDGMWVEWKGIVCSASSVRSMGWDYEVSVRSSSDSLITSSLLFYGKGWGRKVLSLRRGDFIKYSGRIHQMISGYSVSVNVFDFEVIIEKSIK